MPKQKNRRRKKVYHRTVETRVTSEIQRQTINKLNGGPFNEPFGKFKGLIVTPENRNKVLADLMEEYLEKNPDDSETEARVRCLRLINRETKHYRAYLKGKQSYRYMGHTFQVDTDVRRSHEAAKELQGKVFNIENVNNG